MDLNAPLGMTPPPRRRRRLAPLAGVAIGVAALGAIVAVFVLGDPRGGRPFAVATIPPPFAPRPVALDTTPTGTVPPAAVSALPQVHQGEPPAAGVATAERETASRGGGSLESGVMVYRGGTASVAAANPPGPVVIDVTRALDDPLGKARGGTASAPGIPKLAKPAGTPPAAPRPQVAIFVSGMGLDAGATRTATESMPAAVTLAFLPYGSLAAVVDAAKAKGHEVLLQLPMRNEGGAAGPHSLRADATPEATKADLAWLMDRVQGYDGVVNLLGAPVTADDATMSLVLKAVASRHLFYLDDGTSRRSVATRLARDGNVDAAASDLVLDATSDPAAIQANFDRLVALAKTRGHAIGMASGAPEHLGMIARFAAELEGRGVTLVPVAKLVRGGAAATPGPAAAR